MNLGLLSHEIGIYTSHVPAQPDRIRARSYTIAKCSNILLHLYTYTMSNFCVPIINIYLLKKCWTTVTSSDIVYNVRFHSDLILIRLLRRQLQSNFRFIHLLFRQVSDVYRDPYDSREIGLVQVWDLDVDEEVIWTCDEVVSKCYVHPTRPDAGTKSGNPLPDEIRSAGTSAERRERFEAHFEITCDFKWNVHSLLLPEDATIESMVNVERPAVYDSSDEDEADEMMDVD